MLQGFATPEGTARFAARFPSFQQFFRVAQGLTVSSLGIGSYLGEMNEATDANYRDAVQLALRGGINFIDTSLNYRHQRSEISLASGFVPLVEAGELRRDEFLLCTKAGYLIPGALPQGVLRQEDVVGGMHCLLPAFLEDQLERSRRNLQAETIDVFYLHNPETQLEHVGEDEFYRRIALAFERLEQLAQQGRIRYYGAATWNGFRQKQGLSLARMVQCAEQAGGASHRFRWIQLPLNLAMTEALSNGVLSAAADAGITVISSASILQSRLAKNLPDQLSTLAPHGTDAQRAIQFSRSAPGISVSLVGMSNVEHVRENLGITRFAPMQPGDFEKLFA